MRTGPKSLKDVSNVLIKTGISPISDARDNTESRKIAPRRGEMGFTKEIAMIPDMSTPKCRDMRDEPHPN